MELISTNIVRPLFVSLLFIFVLLLNITYNSHISYSLHDRTENNRNMIQFYGCEIYYFATHCYPSSNELENYGIGNDSLKEQLKISSLIYQVTRLPTFVDNEKGKALQLQANRLESIEVTNTLAINPKNLSISFWVSLKSIRILSHTKTITKPRAGHLTCLLVMLILPLGLMCLIMLENASNLRLSLFHLMADLSS